MFVFKSPLFYLVKVPKGKTSDAGHTPKRSREVFPLSEKVKVLDIVRKNITS